MLNSNDPLPNELRTGLARLPRWAAWSLTALCLAGSLWFYLHLETGV